MWYLCGLGSNIDPEQNLVRTVTNLLESHGSLWLSPIIHTRPQGMETDRPFLNALVIVFSPLSPEKLKARFNQLEESLGRDRSDPLCSLKDRPIDVDILEFSESGRFIGQKIEEPYYQRLFDGQIENSVRASLTVAGHTLGQASATIHRDLCAGNEIVVHQGQQLHNHAVKASLPGQQGL